MCIKHQWFIISPTGERRLRDTYYARCSPPCPTPQVLHLPDQYIQPGGMDPFIGGGQDVPIIRPGPQHQQGPLLIRRTTRNNGRNDLRLEFNCHIPGTSRKPKPKRESTTYYYVQQPPQPAGFAPITPPYTPIQLQRPPPAQIRPASPEIVFETIAPRTAAREHERPRPPRAPTAPRETSRERRARRRDEEARRLAEERAAIDARIAGLLAEERARQIARNEARRARANQERLREIDAEIARLQTRLESERRHRRRAQGNILYQEDNPRAHRASREEDRPRDHHRAGFRAARQDPGGGGERAGEPGLAGNTRTARQRARDRDREIRDLETKVNEGERGRRRRRETLPTSSVAATVGDNGTAPFFDPFRRVTRARSGLRTVRVENRNTMRRF